MVYIQNLEDRVKEASETLKRLNVEASDTAVRNARLEEDHGRLRQAVAECQGTTRELNSTSQDLQEGLQQTSANLHSTQQALVGAQLALKTHSGKLHAAEHEVKRLG